MLILEPENTIPESHKQKRILLQDRAAMLSKVRSFFHARNIMEVDCPLLSPRAAVDLHIDLITAHCNGSEKRFLHSSPEYGMKRLLAEGIGDIYQLSHVFRDHEKGKKHSPEFMMAEWYRLNMDYEEMIKETVDFCRLFLGDLPHEEISYREALLEYAGLDYVTSDVAELKMKLPSHVEVNSFDNKDDFLNYILAEKVEPFLGKNALTVLIHYPGSQAALSITETIGDETVAKRFEVYYQGIELANGYIELTDAAEQLLRFQEANQERKNRGKEVLPIDTFFLKALEKGIPECAGVAVGFDRLMMLRHNVNEIATIMPFGWENA